MARGLLHCPGMPEPPVYLRPRVIGAVAILVLALLVIGIRSWVSSSDQQSTDRAVIEARAAQADAVWVVANFKRTQVSGIRPGQSAVIRVREYPDQVFRGRVDAIDQRANVRGRGPRVPVRIVFDQPPDPARPLGPGMPVVATVIVR